MRFSHEAQSAYSVLLPRSLDTFQCRTYSAQFPLPQGAFLAWYSNPIMALANSKHNNLSPPTGYIYMLTHHACTSYYTILKNTKKY